MIRTYPLDDLIVSTTTFINPQTNLPVNPTTVACRVRDPNGVETRPLVTNPQVGVFTAKFTPSLPGRWYVRWECTGTMQSAIEQQLEVTPSAFS